MSDDDDRAFHINKRPGKLYVSKSFGNALTGATLRIASEVIDHEEGLRFAEIKDEIVVRKTPKGRLEIKATFLEDNRHITTLTIQKFNPASGPSGRIYFSFVGQEINSLLQFILGIRAISLGDGSKIHVSEP